ncbi:MAG: hypothetical protein Q8L34_04610 [Candidatus Woesearchaeota archaeon]|nr:hypothetical protein [Candidatus Woesearchaeota archaeon]
MRRIIFIGTIHCGVTDEKELELLLSNYKPNQLLVEIAQEDLDNKKLKPYPPEMVFGYKWAKKHKIQVNGFDSPINVLKEGLTAEHRKRILDKQLAIIKKYNWKDFNKKYYCKKIGFYREYIDVEKNKRRNEEMVKNIEILIQTRGIIVVLTGAGNLTYFEKHVKDTEFPLRYPK